MRLRPTDFFSPEMFRRMASFYNGCALMLLNFLLIFVVLNLFAWFGIKLWQVVKNEDLINRLNAVPPVSREKEASLHQVYPDFGADEIRMVSTETWSRPYIFEPFTQFKERPFQGNFINVSDFGYRETMQPKSWPPDSRTFNIFLFGGSTIFGYGVADYQTVGSYLEEYLNRQYPSVPIRVYNFGRGGYYSSQELVLFNRLLADNRIPAVALFVDGLNEFWFNSDEPFFSEEFRQFVDSGDSLTANNEALHSTLADNFPAYALGYSLKQYLINHTTQRKQLPYNALSDDAIEKVIRKYLHNKELITAVADRFNIKTVFVWQPVPTYNYDLQYHPFIPQGFGQHANSGKGYARMAAYIAGHPQKRNFIWAADIQQGLKEPLYVDKVHYSPKMSKLLAEYIGATIKRNNLIASR